MKKILVLLSAAMMFAINCTAFAAVDISSGKIKAEGISEAAQEPAAGYRAAQVDAYRNLLEQVQGVMIEPDNYIENGMKKNVSFKMKINGVVKGAVVVDKFTDSHGYYHVIVELPVYGDKSLAIAAIPAKNQVAFIEPAALKAELPKVDVSGADTLESESVANQPYTGVIVDCTGLKLQTAMAPGIFTKDSKAIYGLENFSNESVISRGYVGYSKSLTEGVSRAGSNPLVVKAISVDRLCNPVISDEDAASILIANKKDGFLAQGNVIFVR